MQKQQTPPQQIDLKKRRKITFSVHKNSQQKSLPYIYSSRDNNYTDLF